MLIRLKALASGNTEVFLFLTVILLINPGFTATASNAQAVLTWTNPSDDDFEGVRIQRKEGSYPTGATDGANVYTGDDEQATDDEFKMRHCLGDPTLEIWTRNPNRFLVDAVDLHLVGTSLSATYATEGATLTAFRLDGHNILQAVGRGTVVNGVATLELVNTPVIDEELTIAATLPDSVPVQILADVEGPPPFDK